MKTGIIIGKFLPLHKGHMFLIEFGQSLVDNLIILVDNHPSYFLNVEERVSILKKTYPHLDIRGITYPTFQEPSESKDFWPFWKKTIKDHVPETIDMVIGSMDYVERLAEELQCSFFKLDTERKTLNISATEIRDDPFLNWDLIAPESKHLYCKKVAIVGGESVGKTTATEKVSNHFKTSCSMEYARYYINSIKRKLNEDDFNLIQKGQKHLVDLAVKSSNKLMISDTDYLTTCAWYEYFFGHENLDLMRYAKNNLFDYYIHLPSNTKWEKDDVRFHFDGAERDKFDKILIKYLKMYSVDVLYVKSSCFLTKESIIKNAIKEKYKDIL